MKKISGLQITAWILSVLPVALTAVFYSRLPDSIPMRWNNGAAEYEAKWCLWIAAGLAPLFAVLFYVLPHFDPKKRNYSKFPGAYIGFQIAMTLFLTDMVAICIVEALRPGTIDVATVVCLLVGLLMVFLGCIMPKFRMNWYLGIRNTWTLSSDAIWTRTHRLAGKMLFAAGLIGMAGAFASGDTVKLVLLLAPIVGALIAATVFSWRWYRAEQE